MDNLNNITYAEDWKQAYNPVYKEEIVEPIEESVEPVKTKEKKNYKKSYLLIVQLVLCLIVVLIALTLKFVGGDIYNNIRSWYYESLNNEIILTDSFEDFDLSTAFDDI